MATKLEICNLALSHIRAGRVTQTQLDNDSSREALACNTHYDTSLKFVQKTNPFGFNQTIKQLALTDPAVDVFNWAYAYDYPTDCIYIERLILPFEANTADATSTLVYADRNRLYNLYPQDLRAKVEHEVLNIDGARVIVANISELYAKYRILVTDDTLYTADFDEVISWYLAAKIAIPIVGGKLGQALRNDALNMYQSLVNTTVANAIEENHSPPRDSDFITVRF